MEPSQESLVPQLVINGKPNARIVIPATPEPVECFAAEELQKYLQQMSGAELPIVDRAPADRPAIFIGAAAPTRDLDLSEAALGEDGYVIRTTEAGLVLAGAKPYSALYAVYRVLEDHLGCGFFEEGDQVPHRETIELNDVNDVRKPRFSWRNYFANMQFAYSGMRWWTWEEYKPWVEYLAKKRFAIVRKVMKLKLWFLLLMLNVREFL